MPVPYQKLEKCTVKIKSKTWIVAGIQNFIKIRNKLLKKYEMKWNIEPNFYE